MSKKKLILASSIIFFGLVNLSCSQKSAITVHNRNLSHDLIISTVSGKNTIDVFNKSSITEDQDCLEHIKSVTCFSDKEQGGLDTNCSSKELSQEIVFKISDLIETLPSFHQRVFCHINRLQLHTKISSIAYASFIEDEKGNILGNMIGIRLDAIKNGSGNNLFSWKEQLNYGLSKHDDPNYTISNQGPQILLEIPQVKEFLLFDVIVHEVSHLIDFMNEANSEDCGELPENGKKRVTCKPRDNSFSKISWPVYSFLSDGSDWPPKEFKGLYPWLSKLCYYDCQEYISPSNITDVYNELSRSKFVSAYSSRNMREDFAEASTAFVLKSRGFQYKVVLGDNDTLFDLDQNWEAENLKGKRKWLEDFYSRSDLKYQIGSPSK